jgi:acetoin utilization deacetylase AcuC-like enzyme
MTAFFSHPAFFKHEMGPHHPESPERLWAIHDHLTRKGLLPLLDVHEPTQASDEAILRVHAADHLDRLVAAAPKDKAYQALDPDTAMNPHTLHAGYLAAGAVIQAVDLVMSGKARNAFCAVRPPGHHAERNAVMGFCFFNNIAVAAAHALDVHGLERVAIVDFDVHHGNGTEEIFANDERVLMVSTFERSIYPFTGDIPLGSNMLNVPLDAYSDGTAMRDAVQTHWIPALKAFQPELILISAGFDAHREDDMSHLLWTDQDYAWISEQLVRVAATTCGGRIVSSLEGGYHVDALARSVAHHIDALLSG